MITVEPPAKDSGAASAVFLAALFLSTGIALGCYFLARNTRFEMVRVRDDLALKTDKRTGKVWLVILDPNSKYFGETDLPEK